MIKEMAMPPQRNGFIRFGKVDSLLLFVTDLSISVVVMALLIFSAVPQRPRTPTLRLADVAPGPR